MTNNQQGALVVPVSVPQQQQVAQVEASTAVAGGAERERASVMIAAELAWRAPRDEQRSAEALMRSCSIPAFAEEAEYEFPRGKKKDAKGNWVANVVTGPSVYLAREIARTWGNLRYGFEIVGSTDTKRRIVGWCWDLNPHSNTYVMSSDEFSLEIQRKDKETGETRWVEADEREARELMNKRGAICVRNAILQIVPPWLVEQALTKCRTTSKLGASEALKNDRVGTISALREAYAKYDVTVEMIERRIGVKLGEVTGPQLDELRTMWRSIRDGELRVEDCFPPPPAPPQPQAPAAGDPSPFAVQESKPEVKPAPQPKDTKK